jgi:hypothetical protein
VRHPGQNPAAVLVVADGGKAQRKTRAAEGTDQPRKFRAGLVCQGFFRLAAATQFRGIHAVEPHLDAQNLAEPDLRLHLEAVAIDDPDGARCNFSL